MSGTKKRRFALIEVLAMIGMFMHLSTRFATALSILSGHSMAVSGGVVWIWGANSSGQLGIGTIDQIPHPTPIQLTTLSGITTVAGGANHSLALKSNGIVYAWGRNAEGQVGSGMTSPLVVSTPVQVISLTGVAAISGGGNHSLAIAGGAVWAWGSNQYGQLGMGTSDTNPHPTPAQVLGLTGVVSISGGGGHSLALKSDGTVWAWGANTSGQLGDGTNTNRTLPVPVSGLANIVSISAGASHSLAVRSDGIVFAWGSNIYGELGNGTTISHNAPVVVSGLSSIRTVSGGSSYSLALRSDGTVWTWGTNTGGELGIGTHDTLAHSSAVQIGLSSISAICAHAVHSLALKSNGTVWAWGINNAGEIGDGTTTERDSPVQVISLPASTAIAKKMPRQNKNDRKLSPILTSSQCKVRRST